MDVGHVDQMPQCNDVVNHWAMLLENFTQCLPCFDPDSNFKYINPVALIYKEATAREARQ